MVEFTHCTMHCTGLSKTRLDSNTCSATTNPTRGANASRVEEKPFDQNCAEKRFKSPKILSPCQQQSSFLESLEGRWRPSLCIEIQYAEEVGVVLIYSCAHHPDVDALRIKT